jgi:diacylglycerol kinase (ATP)
MTAAVNLPPPTRALLIVNPAARGVAALAGGPACLGLSGHLPTRVIRPVDAGHMAEVVRLHSVRADELLVVAGGDGTLHHAVNALPTPRPLAILPLGTANDFARGAGLPLQLQQASARLPHGRAAPVDVLRINGRISCSAGGFGLPAEVVQAVDALRAPTGAAPSVLSAWRHGLSMQTGRGIYHAATASRLVPRPPVYGLHVRWQLPSGEERTWSTRCLGAFFMNHQRLAGGMPVSPGSVHNDGIFELCVIKESTTPLLAKTLVDLARGVAPSRSVVLPIPARWAKLSLSAPAPLFADGEDQGTTQHIEVAVAPRAFSLVQ